MFAATNPAETLHNLAGQVLLRWKAAGVALPESSPYAAAGRLGLLGLGSVGARPEYLGFQDLLLPAQPIENLEFSTADGGATVRHTGYYWDGLHSQNPPVRDLLDTETRDDKPDEIWVVRINPQEYSPTSLRVRLEEIRDRENDLAGNLSLNQELDHILTVNRWIDKYGNDAPPLTDRKTVVVRTIKMSRDSAWTLDHASKLDRSPRHLAALRAEGTERTERWLADWRAAGDGFPRYPADARYT
ncbi:hypothetical protein [Rhodococcus sp. 14C212]|uniref:hypothetical protein n=1 Tax=Rhodococcus sp. 14C212 TaxID=2711209 RepID=UPI0019807C8B|nr:hypothetical protein [Rhodococcus sp. 14C212]